MCFLNVLHKSLPILLNKQQPYSDLKKMVYKTGILLLGFVALVGAGILVINFNEQLTGQYISSGGGSWYYGVQIAQMQPDEACTYAGYVPVTPIAVKRNEYGTILAVCQDNGKEVLVPTIQRIYVK
ncbi:hypothetical protein COV18_00475 [Candidatus Woesearchaeota archaeon CG10_big_fil_rev_8_21_14_0_10_37_12]|nr:MAG: hypothetical protein COV18_00475 [Candidatus Woesearchaeota archaeon CG10_big_fil_rev_8_21_14_0_10_37_12]